MSMRGDAVKLVRRSSERGFVLITMAAGAVAMLGIIGLAVDVGRAYIAKSETQAFCDSAALAAVLRLDGTPAGLANARTAVANATNTWNMNTQQIPSYSVDFSTGADGPWASNPSPATNYTFLRVIATVPLKLFFLPAVVHLTAMNVASKAVAAQIGITSIGRGVGPLSAVAPNPSAPDFGLVVGNEYDIQWPAYNGTRAGCSTSNPDKCFVQPTCSGEPTSSKSAVVQYWGASVNGYWGDNSNSVINQEVLDLLQTQPLTVGQTVDMSSGNKAAEATALDSRVNQDTDTIDNTVPAYVSNPNRNGRRLIPLPVLSPTASGTYVVGFAAFLLETNGTPSNYYRSVGGNDAFCAIYAGPYVQGGTNPGASSSTGSYRVALVQ
jgi:Flp pilus assembly protein TadG